MYSYNICYSSDENYVEQLLVSITSILKNADDKDILNFYILDGGLKEKDKLYFDELKKIKDFHIEFIEVNFNDFKDCPILKEKDDEYKDYHVTLPTYFRFKLPKYFPLLDKILYLDCDTIIRDSLKELFNINIDNFAALMCEDAECKKEAERLGIEKYFNAGVMLINLNYWRENNISKQLFEFAKNNQVIILWQDQDIINCVLDKKILSFDKIWNYQYFLYEYSNAQELSDCRILHLAGRFKPWLMPFKSPIYDIYYYYLSFTPLKKYLVKYCLNAFNKSLKNNTGGAFPEILINAYDEDIQKVYKEITNLYKHFEELLDTKINASTEYISSHLENLINNKIDVSTDHIVNHLEWIVNNKVEASTEHIVSHLENLMNNKIDVSTEHIVKHIEGLMNNKIDVSAKFVSNHLEWIVNNKVEASTEHIVSHLENLMNNKIDATAAFLIKYFEEKK